jgi:beta-ketoacyl synthase-like protein
MKPAPVAAPTVLATGLISGWGRGLDVLPEDARVAAGGRDVITVEPPSAAGDRFRRATRECLLALAAVEEALLEAGTPRAALRGDRTALIYVTASAYAAANRAFIEARGATALHFPYTAPSAVPAEVAIEFGITGPYVTLLGGPPAALSALWYAATLLASSQCDRALVLAVETFRECADLFARGRWLVGRPLVESAACAVLGPGAGELTYSEHRVGRAGRLPATPVARRLGEAFACVPLAELGAARAAAPGPLNVLLTGAWRGARAALRWTEARPPWNPTKPSRN